MFDAYTLALMVSGALLIIVGAAVSRQSTGTRVLNLLFGVGFLGYGFYLEFLFTGDSYRVFPYAFLAPIVLIVQTFKARKAAKEAAAERTSVAEPIARTTEPTEPPSAQAIPTTPPAAAQPGA